MTDEPLLIDVTEPVLCRLAELVALMVRSGEGIALNGELGVGKTTFARAFIRGVLDDADAEIPSPTFTLLQTYDSARFPIAHLDLYRLSGAGEIEELWADEIVEAGVTVVEWSERATDMLPASRLEVHLREADAPDTRTVRFVGHGAWASRLERLGKAYGFLAEAVGPDAWSRARARYLQGDASLRSYARLELDDATCVFMNAPHMPDGPPVRGGLPYSRIAHLAEDVRPFVAMAQALRVRGLSAPRLYAGDMSAGFLLLEDLGDLTFPRALQAGYCQRELWRAAVDALVALRTPSPTPFAAPESEAHVLMAYDRGALGIETELLVDWYWPCLRGSAVGSGVREDYVRLWGAQFDCLTTLPQGLALRDFHSPNLMWMPERQGLDRVGILDFQDALIGPWAYDLVSLLQDARVDVAAALEAELVEIYCEQVAAIEPDFDRTSFAYAYAALGAQRNSKILGIFARLARRDAKPVYLQHLPRIWGYLERDLAHPSLARLRHWYDRHFPQAIRATVPAAW